METDTVVLRGFSNTFGMEKKVEVMDLQFIEGEELERTWKAARRQRVKQQEDKIWKEFVKEEDVLQSLCKEDPYQFLNQIPPDKANELVECELSRIKQELEDKHGAGDSPRPDKHTVTFSEVERDEVFEIYDDNDESGNEENLNDTLESPCTVRERDDTSGENTERERIYTVARASGASVAPSLVPTEKNSAENVATVIESSIYCAKVKDLRIKIIRELQEMIISLENQNIASFDSCQLRKLCKRASEYSARFQRIHLYQLQRTVNDIKRHNSMATPYAKHTQFQSQMVRIVALHQNALQSLQVFHKSFEHTACLRECSTVLRMMCTTLRDSTAACLEVAAPTDFSAAKELYNDAVSSICDELEKGVGLYIARVDEYIAAAEQIDTARGSKRCNKNKAKKRTWSQKGTKNTSDVNHSLSMYSIETLRFNQSSKTITARRPLMRDPHCGLERRRAPTQPDHDIQTMVENVEAQSSRMSDTSPNSRRSMAQSPRLRKYKQRASPHAPRPPLVPPIELNTRSAHAKNSPTTAPMKRISPYIKPALSNLRSETMDTGTFTCSTQSQQGCVSPVSKVQCAKKDFKPYEDFQAQTVMSDCKQPYDSGKIGRYELPRKLDTFTEESETCGVGNLRSELSKARLDSARSETSRGSPVTRRKPSSARSDGREAEGYEMTRLLKHLCAGENIGNKSDRLTGSKNAQLLCVNASSPRQPTTPQLLRILEQTIQKKIPKDLYSKMKHKDVDRLRLAFNIPQQIADNLFQYRTKFVQHMLTSSMYANSTIGKPWEMVGSVSEQIIDEILMQCAEEMQIKPIIMELFNSETQ